MQKFADNIILEGGASVIGFRLENLPSPPAFPYTGQMYYNTSTNRIMQWNGTIWDAIPIFSDLKSIDGSLFLTNGGYANQFLNEQLLFSLQYTKRYAHAIRSRHDGGSPVNNSIDFYLWKTTDDTTTAGGSHCMSVTAVGLGVGTFFPTEKIDVIGNVKISGQLKLAGLGTQYVDGSGNFKALPTAVVQTFTTSGVWTKPANAKVVEVVAIGGGSGGGSGRKGLSTAVRSGGGGGSGAAYSSNKFDATLLPTTVEVTVGAGGIGGAAIIANSTNGNNGTNGGASSFGVFITAQGGNFGGAGTATTSTGGGTAGNGYQSGSQGAGSSGASAGVGGQGNVSPNVLSATGGASGGGISASNNAFAGATGGSKTLGMNVAGGIAGAIGMSGGNGNVSPFGGSGSGAGGGGASITGNGGNGGNGGDYGGGGGGGGASTDNVGNSGAGGNGGAGVVIVTTYF